MKATILGWTLVFIVAGGWSAVAGDTATEKKDQKSKETQKAKVEESTSVHNEKTALTGTYIPRKVRRHGMITDGFSQVQVIDSDTIRASGATDVRQLLNRQGIH